MTKAGIDPKPNQKLKSVSFSGTLTPAKLSDGMCLQIYSQAPGTTREVTGSLSQDAEVHGNLEVSLPSGVVPGVAVGAGATGKSVYTRHLQFSHATITAATNGNDLLSWTFLKSKTDDEDPRGAFRLLATIGVPRSFGRTNEELSKRVSVVVDIEANLDGSFFSRAKPSVEAVPIRFG